MSKTDNYTFLTQAPIPQVIGTMAVPTIISMLVSNMYNIVDSYFVGQINTQATAAVGIVASLQFMIQAFSFFFGNGTGNFISRELGRKRHKQARIMASTGFFYTLVTALLILAAGEIWLEELAVILGSTPTIQPYTETYMSIILLGTPFIMCSFCINNQMRFEGYAKYSMYGIVSGAVLNCVLDPLLIFGLNMGLAGAAWATVIGQAVGFMVMWRMSRMRGAIHYSWRRISLDKSYIKEILAGGTPSISRQGLACLAVIMLNHSAGMFGDAAIAAMSIVNRVTMFINSVIIGLGQGFQPMCGFCYGAAVYRRVKQGFWFCVRIGVGFHLFWTVILFIFSAQTIALFRDDPHVIAIGVNALRFQAATYILSSFMMMSNMMMQTCRMPWKANFVAAARQGLFFIPLVLILPRWLGLTGLEMTQAVSDVLSTLCTIPITWHTFRQMTKAEGVTIAGDKAMRP